MGSDCGARPERRGNLERDLSDRESEAKKSLWYRGAALLPARGVTLRLERGAPPLALDRDLLLVLELVLGESGGVTAVGDFRTRPGTKFPSKLRFFSKFPKHLVPPCARC